MLLRVASPMYLDLLLSTAFPTSHQTCVSEQALRCSSSSRSELPTTGDQSFGVEAWQNCWSMTSSWCQRRQRAHDGWPTLLERDGKQLRWWLGFGTAAGALPCTSRSRADRDATLPVPEVQSGTTMLICIFSKQTPYPGATALHALSNAPMREF